MHPTANAHIPLLSDIPVVGVALFSLPWVAYAAMALCVLVWWFFQHSRQGLKLMAVGDSPVIAHQLGFKVVQYRGGR